MMFWFTICISKAIYFIVQWLNSALQLQAHCDVQMLVQDCLAILNSQQSTFTLVAATHCLATMVSWLITSCTFSFLVIFIILFDFYFYLFIYLFLLCLQWCEERRWHVLGRGQRTVALLQWWLTSMRAVYSTGGWSLKDIWPVSIPYLLHISLMSSHLMLFSNINLYK